jgi:hypothetical protein
MSLNVIAAIILIFLIAALFGAFMVYYQLRRQWLEQQFKDLQFRQKHYLRFIHDLSLDASIGDDEAHHKLLAHLDSLLIVAAPHLIPKILEFQKFMRVSNVWVLRNSEIWLEQRDEISRNLIQALRADIYGYEASTDQTLSEWKPLSRTIRKPGPRFEVIPLKPFAAKLDDSEFRQQK